MANLKPDPIFQVAATFLAEWRLCEAEPGGRCYGRQIVKSAMELVEVPQDCEQTPKRTLRC
jgi:hypothetical protein